MTDGAAVGAALAAVAAAAAAAAAAAGVAAIAATGVAADAGDVGIFRIPDRLSVEVDCFTPPLPLALLPLTVEPALPPLALLLVSSPPSSRYGGGDGDGPGGMNTENDTE
jgi:hypothetical protein